MVRSAEETKDSIGPFLTRQGDLQRFLRLKNITEYIVVERIAPKK